MNNETDEPEEEELVDGREGRMDWPLVGLLVIFSAAFVFYGVTTNDSTNTDLHSYSLILLAILIILIIIYIYLTILHPSTKLRKKLEQAAELLDKAPLDVLKNKYMEIYNLYLKLTYSQKRNFYARVIQMREAIEHLMVKGKKIEAYLEDAQEGTISQRKKKYNQAFELHQTLPQSIKERFHADMANLRDKLESRKKK